jgi:hypothetical protein
MRIIGCDLHSRQQTLAMLDTTTGEVVKKTQVHALLNEGGGLRSLWPASRAARRRLLGRSR